MNTNSRSPIPALALLMAFVEAVLKRFADKGTLGVKLSGYQPE